MLLSSGYWDGKQLDENLLTDVSYAQTELGHGSGIANLETTATLDKVTDEWVINSPTLSVSLNFINC